MLFYIYAILSSCSSSTIVVSDVISPCHVQPCGLQQGAIKKQEKKGKKKKEAGEEEEENGYYYYYVDRALVTV